MTARLCLNMIVKNEAKILERCLASVAPWISTYAIADTGSTDGTPDLIRKFFDDRKIPGVVQEGVPFEDFSQARNAALEVARSSPHPFEYMLLTDADMELVVEDETFRDNLSGAAYLVTQNADLSYGNVRLVKRTHPCRYVEPTHEYLDTGIGQPPTLKGIWFRDWAEGSNRSDKSERDMRLLRGALEKNPQNGRAHFYLAQTYKDLGRFLRAIEHYEKRIAIGGFPEEVWYSQYMIAVCERELGHEPEMVRAALKAFEMRPHRAEPLHVLAKYYRERGRNDLAVLYARHGADLAFPKEDILFVEPFVYEHGFREEISISGFYSRIPVVRSRAERECYDIVLDPHAPHGTRSVAYGNIIFYARPLAELCSSAKCRAILGPDGHALEAPEVGLNAMNPSVTRAPNGRLLANIRWVNYSSDAAKRRVPWPAIVRTENQIGELDPETGMLTRVKNIRKPLEPLVPLATNNPVVLGYEDLRIFFWKNRLWATCTVRDRADSWLAQIMMLGLEETEDAYVVTSERILPAPDPDRHQKNWVPLVDTADALHFVYESDPTTIMSIASDTMTAEAKTMPPFACEHFRGSSQAILFELEKSESPGFLYLIHEAFDHYGGHRHYTHRFVWLDHAMSLVAVSDPFFFTKKSIEFAAGLASADADTLVASFGLEDGAAWMATMNADDVRAMLRQNRARSA